MFINYTFFHLIMALLAESNIIVNRNIKMMTVRIALGTYIQEELIPIICPDDDLTRPTHKIIKNGKDTSVKGHPQQYYCQYCFQSFYSHTSKIFENLKEEFQTILAETLTGGRIDIKAVSNRLNLKAITVSRLLSRVLEEILKKTKNVKSYLNKHRNSNCLIVDETFITIDKKTWYLILVVSGNNKIMGFRLVERRDQEIIFDLIKDCANRLTYGFQILVTDGFLTYKGVAMEMAKNMKKELIHVRHIHKPPYGRIEVDMYQPNLHGIKLTTVKTTNEITAVNGFFIGRVHEKMIKITNIHNRGRKVGSKNRPKEVIAAEKEEQAKQKKARGRPKGSKNPVKKPEEIHVFFHNKKDCQISAIGESSDLVAAGLNKILTPFQGIHITSNLIEKEFSVLKKLICFRGRRDAAHWLDLLTAYYAIRDDPKILNEAIENITIPSQMITYAIPSLIHWEIKA